jgi:hypothetical protein
MESCVEYKIVGARGRVIRTASACSEKELEIAKGLVELVNKKFGMNFKIVVKKQ